jgi:DNA-binding transcriptional LysR family regulator
MNGLSVELACDVRLALRTVSIPPLSSGFAMHPFNPYKIKISQLVAFVAIADHGTFSAAALALDLSQSTVSHAIAALEAELGVQLIKRSRQGAQLTVVGDRVMKEAHAILRHLDNISQEANQARGLRGGQVHIAAYRSMATHLLPSAISRLHDLYPTIKVKITEFDEFYNIEKALLNGQADLSVAELPEGDEFETWEILCDDYLALMPPSFTGPTQLTWADLAAYPLIVSSVNTCSHRIHNCLKTVETSLNIAYELREDSTIIGMVLRNLGAAILPRMAAEPIPKGIKVCKLPCVLTRTIGIAMLKDALHPPAVYAFLDALRQAGMFT